MKMHFGLLIAAIALSGCVHVPPAVPAAPTAETLRKQATEEALVNEWVSVGDGVDRMRLYDAQEDATLYLYRFPESASFRFEQQASPLLIDEWRETYPSARAILNGVYFHEDFTPSGMLITQGERLNERTFDLDRSGFLSFEPFALIDTSVTEVAFDQVREGAQSFPFLITDGLPAVREDSGQVGRRSFLGVDNKGNRILGVVPNDLLSLYQLSQILDRSPVEWISAINLDGGPSTGISLRLPAFEESFPSYAPIPNIILVE